MARKKHETTRAAVFAEPVRANISWADIEAMLVALGATVREGEGSWVGVSLGGLDAVFHRPHPGKEASRPLVRSVRAFLSAANFGLEGENP
jgi:hypothetical protein